MNNLLRKVKRLRKNMFHIFNLVLCCFIAWAIHAPTALAVNNCTIATNGGKPLNISIDLPQLRPSSKGVTGTVLASKNISIGGITYTCGNLIRNTWRSSFTRPESVQQAMTNVYNTSIPGLGIRMKWPSSRSMFFPNAAECLSQCTEPADSLLLEFVQTGVISAGTIPAGLIGRVTLLADSSPGTPVDLMTISLSMPVDVQPKACAILTPSQSIDLGAYSVADFNSNKVRSGKIVPFNIVVNCPQTTSMQFKFYGEHPVGTTKGFINNCGQKDCAQKIGVKFMNDLGSGIDTTGIWTDATGAAGKSTSITTTTNKTFKYKAQIVPQTTGPAVTPGKISSYLYFDVLMN
jgi:hypothetical protein